MRHGKKVNHLSRKVGHRKALLRNMASSLILHKRINTTLAKAKALRQYVEPVINSTKGIEIKEDKMNASRLAFRYLQDKFAVKELFEVVAEKVVDRNGGYTRIIKLGTRLGDNAELAMIELVDFNSIYTQSKGAATATKRKRRRGGKSLKEGSMVDESTTTTPTNEVETTADTESIVDTELTTDTESIVDTQDPASAEESEEEKKEQ